jgi:hypothetical protein
MRDAGVMPRFSAARRHDLNSEGASRDKGSSKATKRRRSTLIPLRCRFGYLTKLRLTRCRDVSRHIEASRTSFQLSGLQFLPFHAAATTVVSCDTFRGPQGAHACPQPQRGKVWEQAGCSVFASGDGHWSPETTRCVGSPVDHRALTQASLMPSPSLPCQATYRRGRLPHELLAQTGVVAVPPVAMTNPLRGGNENGLVARANHGTRHALAIP